MIHPHTELRRISDSIGHGVFALKRIPRGTITWALDYLDHVFTPEQVAKLPSVYHPIIDRYAFRDNRDRAVLCWDHGRFVNHSCESTTLPLGSICEIAVRDIEPGEQITSDYVTLNLEKPMRCQCGAARCRGTMDPAHLSQYVSAIDSQIAAIVPDLQGLEQPVLPFMFPEDRERFLAIAAQRTRAPSCREILAGH